MFADVIGHALAVFANAPECSLHDVDLGPGGCKPSCDHLWESVLGGGFSLEE